MAKAPVMRLTARRTASSNAMVGFLRVRTASDSLASGATLPLGLVPAARFSSSSIR